MDIYIYMYRFWLWLWLWQKEKEKEKRKEKKIKYYLQAPGQPNSQNAVAVVRYQNWHGLRNVFFSHFLPYIGRGQTTTTNLTKPRRSAVWDP